MLFLGIRIPVNEINGVEKRIESFLAAKVTSCRRKDSKLRKVDMEIVRDPYHSTFNYLWQMLRPALVESVGVSKKEQDAALKVAGFFTKVKRFFGLDKKKDKRKEIDTNNKEIESLKE